MEITTIGIDLSKNVFQIHGVDQRGKTALKKQLKRVQMLPYCEFTEWLFWFIVSERKRSKCPIHLH